MQDKEKAGTIPKLSYRKTSAEIVSEARNSLMAGSNVRLVSTRRPITPNVNKRQLYGVETTFAGRPPSAFNLKYLQYETRAALPCLEPISQGDERDALKKVERSGSLGTIHEVTKTKLPALLEPPRIATAGSLENRKSSRDKIIHLRNLNVHPRAITKSINEMSFSPFSFPQNIYFSTARRSEGSDAFKKGKFSVSTI